MRHRPSGYHAGEMIHHRHYTVDEANAKLDHVGRIVRRIRDARVRLSAEGFDARLSSLAELSGGAHPGPEHAAAALEVALGFDHLEELDVVVRNLERGLIDFPSLLGGEEVYLCWLLEEPTVSHWHAPEAGFGGRRPL
jgi:Uncharacterized conserved protein (DUF2203)